MHTLVHGFIASADGLVIPWKEMPTYNTIMAVAGGAVLLLLIGFFRQLLTNHKNISTDGYALAFAVLGLILTITGTHMVLTWPLAGAGFAYDNIIFGEPSLALGVAALAAAWYFWTRLPKVLEQDNPWPEVGKVVAPSTVLGVGMGFGSLGIGVAGVYYQLFAAPKEEPLSGLFADYPLIEATFVSSLYWLLALGCFLLPFVARQVIRIGDAAGAKELMKTPLSVVFQLSWFLGGLAFFGFGALNYFTHIGLIVNTLG